MSKDEDFELFSCSSSEDDFEDLDLSEEVQLLDTSDDESQKDPPSKKSKIGPISWGSPQQFPSMEQAILFMENQKKWTKKSTNQLKTGFKTYYDCKVYRQQQCFARLSIDGFDGTQEVQVSVSNNQHTCGEKKTLTPEHKEVIHECLMTMGVSAPSKVNKIFEEKKLKELKCSIIVNYTQRLKRELFHPIKTYEQFTTWCESQKRIDDMVEDEVDTPIVLGFESISNQGKDNYLRAAFSTRRLLQNSLKFTSLNADATYKLNLHGLPVILVGSTDKQRHFHPSCIAVCSTESSADFQFVFHHLQSGVEKECQVKFQPKILIADAAGAITQGFERVYGPGKRVYCWAHVMRNLLKKIKSLKIPKETTNKILNDIRLMQRSSDEKMFKATCLLFQNKWKEQKEFVSYFVSNWVNINSGWYAGYALGYPVTNNALEATNNVIKLQYTVREKLVFQEFVVKLLKIVGDWSKARDPKSPNFKPFWESIEIHTDLWVQGISWKNEDRTKSNKDKSCYYSPASGTAELLPAVVLEFESARKKCTWTRFDDFSCTINRLWKIDCLAFDWKIWTCTCPIFQKHYVCKHIVGLAIMRKQLVVPPGIPANATTILVKPQRGRPKDSAPVRQVVQHSTQAGRPRGRPRKVSQALSL